MSPTEQIKERLSIVDVVSSYIKLEKAGRNLKARCPFHSEKTPSFMVSPERGSFHCFGCNKGGDIFTFVEEIEGVEFKEALRMLAERAGVELAFEKTEIRNERKALFTILEEAVLYFQKQLQKTSPAAEYLKERGLALETVQEFRIGFAPPEWRSVGAALYEKGYAPSDLEKAGLVIQTNGKWYDRFRGRIMFPLADGAGRIVGFSGRIFENEDAVPPFSGSAGERRDEAKYINSPETLLYNKSKTLYGFDKAKTEIRRENKAVLVEGQFDVILSHQAGVTNAVAASGTAFTPLHAVMIRRLAEELLLAYDADEAGLKAAGRGIETALGEGLTVKLVALPSGTDPADFIIQNPDGWKQKIKEAKHAVDFYLEAFQERIKDSRMLEKEVETRVLPFVARMQSKIEQAHYVRVIAKALGMAEEPVWEEVRKHERRPNPGIAQGTGHNAHSAHTSADGQKFSARAAKKTLSRATWRQNTEERIAGIIVFLEKNAPEAAGELKKEFERIAQKNVGDFSTEGILFEMEVRYDEKNDAKAELEELLLNLKRHIAKVKLQKAAHDLKYAESKGDEETIAAKSKEFHELARELEKLKSSVL